MKLINSLLTSFVLTISYLVSFSATADTNQIYKLALNWKPEPQFGGFYQSLVDQEFEKQGLKVEILPGGSGTPTIQMVASGKVDFAVVAGDELVLAHERGQKDLVALFAVYQTNPQGILVHENSPHQSIQDILKSEGKLSWLTGIPFAQYLLKKYQPVKVTQVPYPGGLTLFYKDKSLAQQCFITSEPITAKKDGIKVRAFLIADTGFNPYTTVLVTKRANIESGNAKKMTAAVRAGWNNYLKSSGAANNFMSKLNPAMDLKTFAESAEVQKSLIQTKDIQGATLGRMQLERWETLIQQLYDLKVIKSKIKAENLFVNL